MNVAKLGHAVTVEHTRLHAEHEFAVVASLLPVVGVDASPPGCSLRRLLPVVAEDADARELRDRDLGFAGAVGAHQARVLTRLQRALREHDFSPGVTVTNRSARERLLAARGATPPTALRQPPPRARRRRPRGAPASTRSERPRRGLAVDAGADHGRRVRRRSPSVSAASTAAAPVRSAVTAPASSTATGIPFDASERGRGR